MFIAMTETMIIEPGSATVEVFAQGTEVLTRPSLSNTEGHLALSSALLLSGQVGRSIAEAEAVLAEPGLSDHEYAAAELARLGGLLVDSDIEQVRAPAEAILAGDRARGSDAALAGALTALSFIAWDEGRVADAIALLRAGIRRADDAGATAHALAMHPRLALATMLAAVGQFALAQRVIDQAADDIRLGGDEGWSDVPAIVHARVQLAAGDIDDAVVGAATALVAIEERETSLFAPLAVSTLAMAALLRGDISLAAGHVARYRALPLTPRLGVGSGSFAWVEARLTEVQQGPTRALEVLGVLCSNLAAHKRLFVEEPGAAAWLVRTALATGDRGRATMVVNLVAALAADNRDVPSVVTAHRHADALLTRDADRLERAAREHSHPWARGSAFEDAGAAHAASLSRDVQPARHAYECAAEAYASAGAKRDTARVQRRLRDLSRNAGTRRRPVSGWASLTTTEERVALVVAEGCTNAEVASRMYLSRHTVDFHLRQIFRKLAIRSRVELTRIVMQRAIA
jgi:DNA-binding CsgD family transcriptional regulator